MPTVKVSLDNVREDATVEIPYLGYFPNDGGTHDVEQSKWDRFVTLSPVGQTLEEGTTHYELTTEAQKQSTRDHNALRQVELDSLEEDFKKDELERMATTSNIDTSGKTKSELAEDIKKSQSGREPNDFSSVAEANEDKEG